MIRFDQEAETDSSTQVTVKIRTDMAQLLKNIKIATQQVIRLSLITAFLIIVGSALHMIDLYSKDFMLHMAGVFSNEIYIVSNPFVYVYVMADLRKHYTVHLRQFFRLLRPPRQINVE